LVEFFQIVAKEIFDLSYGLFQTNTESRMSWFSFWDTDPEQDMLEEYNLLGKLIGLAFYNGVPLDINFPPALYKKILNCPLSLDDVMAFDPVLFSIHSNGVGNGRRIKKITLL
jgi:ubiquitin-protein ligase E3 A